MAEPLKQGQVLGLEALAGGPSADRSLEMLADGTLVTVFMGESWRSFSLEQWDALHEAGVRLLAAERGRKVLELASLAGMALFQLAADVEEAIDEAVGLDDMTDAHWLRVGSALDGSASRGFDSLWPALRDLWKAAGEALGATAVRTVWIPASDQHEGFHSIRVTLPWTCPQCGGPRGEPFKTISYDGSRRLGCDGWKNACGHVDGYADVRAEARALAEADDRARLDSFPDPDYPGDQAAVVGQEGHRR